MSTYVAPQKPNRTKAFLLLASFSLLLASALVVAFWAASSFDWKGEYSTLPQDVYATSGASLQGKYADYWKGRALGNVQMQNLDKLIREEGDEVKVEESEIEDTDIQQIAIDYQRLGTEDPEEKARILGLLYRAARKYPSVGYVQGMGHMAALVVKTLGAQEEPEVLFGVFDAFLKKAGALVSLENGGAEFHKASAWISETVSKLSPSSNNEALELLTVSSLPCLFTDKSRVDHVQRLWSVLLSVESSVQVSFKQYLLLFTAVMFATQKPSEGTGIAAYEKMEWDLIEGMKQTNALIAKIKSGKCPEISLNFGVIEI